MSFLHLLKERQIFKFNSKIGSYYFNLRKKGFKNTQTKSSAVSYALETIRSILQKTTHPVVMDFGCFDGHVLGEMKKVVDKKIKLIGIDFNTSILTMAKKQHTGIHFYKKDICAGNFKKFTRSSDMVLCINTLHEIYSIYGRRGKKAAFDEQTGKRAVGKALKNIAVCLKKNGVCILFDGVAPSLPPKKLMTIQFSSVHAKNTFLQFVKEYKTFSPLCTMLDTYTYQTNVQTFSYYITKHQFLHTPVWKIEQDECYQYFTKEQFIKVCKHVQLKVEHIECFSPKCNTWQQQIKILDLNPSFFTIHILIEAKKQ